MDLSINVGYFGPHISDDHELISKLDDLGFSCIWTAEAYGYDAVTPLSYFSAITKNINIGSGIMQIPGRTPAMTAMTAITLDKLSNGRFRLGLGVSGPQVVEGWHGQPYSKPLSRTREYIKIIRQIFQRENKVVFDGEFYNLPYNGPDSLNLGKPLKLIEPPLRNNIPIYLAAIGPKNIELSAEVADGWLPFMYSPTKGDMVFKDYLKKGFEKSGVPNKDKEFNIVATVFARLCEEHEVDEYFTMIRCVDPVSVLSNSTGLKLCSLHQYLYISLWNKALRDSILLVEIPPSADTIRVSSSCFRVVMYADNPIGTCCDFPVL